MLGGTSALVVCLPTWYWPVSTCCRPALRPSIFAFRPAFLRLWLSGSLLSTGRQGAVFWRFSGLETTDRSEAEAAGPRAPRHEALREEAPEHEAPREEAPGHEAPSDEAPGHEAPGHEAPGDDAPGHGNSGHAVPRDEAPGDGGHGVTRHRWTRHRGTGHEASGQEAPRQDAGVAERTGLEGAMRFLCGGVLGGNGAHAPAQPAATCRRSRLPHAGAAGPHKITQLQSRAPNVTGAGVSSSLDWIAGQAET